MNKQILEIINNLKGSLLGIGLNDNTFLDAIEQNNNINTCYLLNNISLTGKKFSITKRGKNKKINIKKIKKYFKKKSLDNIIVNYDTIKQFYRSFIPNSIYLNKDTLYIYGNKNDLENLKQKYLLHFLVFLIKDLMSLIFHILKFLLKQLNLFRAILKINLVERNERIWEDLV